MAKIIQVLDVNSDGHRLRLDNGKVVTVPHGTGQDLNVGDELKPWMPPVPFSRPIAVVPDPIAPSIEHLNSPEQVKANIPSEIVTHVNTDDGTEHGAGSIENASSEPSAAGSDGDSRTSAIEAQPEE